MEVEFSPLLRWFDPLGKEEEVEGEFSLPLRWFDPLVPTPFVSRFRQPAKETKGTRLSQFLDKCIFKVF